MEYPSATQAIEHIERAMARDVGRGSEQLEAHTAGNLLRAAEALLARPQAQTLIITGFYVSAARASACETDGPIGAVQLAAVLQALGGRVRILTDAPCAPVVQAAIAAAGGAVPLDVAPLGTGKKPTAYDAWESQALAKYQNVGNVIAIERVGPGADGTPRNMRGEDVSAHHTPLHRLFAALRAYKIGIGDGGNELGMGALPPALVERATPLGEQIRCAVSCDALLVGGTSNWAAAGLAAALLLLAPAAAPDDAWTILKPEWQRAILKAISAAGALDGVSRERALTVDGFAWPAYADVLTAIELLARS